MRFVLSGYYGFSNAGDEAVLAGALTGLRKAGVEARVLSAQPAVTREQHGAIAFRRNSLRDVRRALSGADLFLSGGGGLLQDSTSVRSLVFYLFMLRLARMHAVPTMIFAQGIGPLLRKISRALVRREANAARCITVRDAKSRQILESIGVTRGIEVSADASFLMNPVDDAAADSLWHTAGLDSLPHPIIAAALRPWRSSEWVGEAAAGLGHAARGLGRSVLLLPFQHETDYPLAISVSGQLDCPSRTVEFPATPVQLLGLISRSDVIVGMRLHGLIFAVMSSTPCVALSYDPKVDAFAEEAALPESIALDGVSRDDLSSAILACWKRRPEEAERLKIATESFRARAARSIELALKAAGG